MRKYVLTSTEARENVDLREYSQLISDAVLEVVEDDEPLINTAKDYYQVEMDTPMTETERYMVDAILRTSELGKYVVGSQMLFTAVEEEGDRDSAN